MVVPWHAAAVLHIPPSARWRRLHKISEDSLPAAATPHNETPHWHTMPFSQVVVGGYPQSVQAPADYVRNVIAVRRHRKFNLGFTQDRFDNDVALLLLDKPIAPARLKTITLPNPQREPIECVSLQLVHKWWSHEACCWLQVCRQLPFG